MMPLATISSNNNKVAITQYRLVCRSLGACYRGLLYQFGKLQFSWVRLALSFRMSMAYLYLFTVTLVFLSAQCGIIYHRFGTMHKINKVSIHTAGQYFKIDM